MKKQSSILLAMVVLLAAGSRAGAYSGGSGEPNDPYLIATAEDMNEIGAEPNDWDAHFLLTADINLADYTGTQFNIIGNDSTPFTGVFDGNGYTISNFTYTTTDTDNIGIFGYVDHPNAEIKDLTLTNPNVNAAGSSYYVGCLVGYLRDGTISGCGIEGGSVLGDRCTGGLVGYNEGSITSCYATGSVTGNSNVGGLVGWNEYGTLTACYATGSVSGTGEDSSVGGLVGYNNSDGTLTSCYATASVSGTGWDSCVGGLVGLNAHGTTLTACYATGSVSGGSSVGGLVGCNYSGTPVSYTHLTLPTIYSV